MAEIESDTSQFSCSGQLAPVSLAPVLCKWKRKCAQREGKKRRGCPCKTAGQKCHSHCACRPRQCLNRLAVSIGRMPRFEPNESGQGEFLCHLSSMLSCFCKQQVETNTSDSDAEPPAPRRKRTLPPSALALDVEESAAAEKDTQAYERRLQVRLTWICSTRKVLSSN